MDAIDRGILGELVRNARVSYRDLGATVGLSANAAAERVRRLRRAGVITGFPAPPDPRAPCAPAPPAAPCTGSSGCGWAPPTLTAPSRPRSRGSRRSRTPTT